MGRSTASCFKIITCGSESVDNDGVEASESKESRDKRGWSFRKRSASQQVLSNIVISEKPSFSKESIETAAVNLQSQSDMTCPDKTSAMPLTDEKPQLSATVNLKVSDSGVVMEDDKLHDVNPDESIIVIIQASIRQFLAQREMLKVKNIVKLQAAVRGNTIRRQAAGTLRCIQAIIKIQALIRARHARLTSKGSYENYAKDNHCQNHLQKGNSVDILNKVHKSIEKLLSNKFANQLLESTPRNKHIRVKCDPCGSDPAWDWLERWTSVLSTGVQEPQKSETAMVLPEHDKVYSSSCQMESQLPPECPKSTDQKADVNERVIHSKSEESLVSDDKDNRAFQECSAASSPKIGNLELPHAENSGTLEQPEESLLDLLPTQSKQSHSISRMTIQSSTGNPERESEQPTYNLKRFAPDQVETEGKKFASGTRRATSPAFIAVKSKFEELSPSANSPKSTNTCNQDDGVESNSKSISSTVQNVVRTGEIGSADHSFMPTSSVKVGSSECGTELSIACTLGSPDSSDIGKMNIRQNAEPSAEATSTKNLDVEADGQAITSETDSPYTISIQPGKLDHVNGADGEPSVSVKAADSLREKQEAETTASNVQLKLEDSSEEMYRPSAEASPRSHVAIPEAQGTPSSQVSAKAERTKSNRGSSDQKRKSLSAGKKSTSSPKHESGVKNSSEQLPKDHKSGKRRNSFGFGKSDSVDLEPRDSNSGSPPLPNYMQATESARAKSLANSSPRSSPDVHDKDMYVKKRRSLPGASAKQGSPRVQQGAKGNDHLHEKKWQR